MFPSCSSRISAFRSQIIIIFNDLEYLDYEELLDIYGQCMQKLWKYLAI